jgi:Ni,Fe-hydrogenase III large subunit
MEQALHLVSRVCGSDSHAHSMAFCQAIELLAGIHVPERAAYLRCIVAEIERVASHLDTLTRLFDVLGQREHGAVIRELSYLSREAMKLVSGARVIPDMCVPGGLRRDVSDEQCSELAVFCSRFASRLSHQLERLTGDRALSARTVDVGVLAQHAAEQFGMRGPVARASGIKTDTRLDDPYAAYPYLLVSQLVEEAGDVYARLMVLLLEVFESVQLMEHALKSLPGGPCEGRLPAELPDGRATAVVESPRGRLHYTVEGDGRRLTSATIDAPRQLDRLLARALLSGAMLDNVALIVLSLSHCPACAEC